VSALSTTGKKENCPPVIFLQKLKKLTTARLKVLLKTVEDKNIPSLDPTLKRFICVGMQDNLND